MSVSYIKSQEDLLFRLRACSMTANQSYFSNQALVSNGRLTMQGVCPGRENNAFCTSIGDLEVEEVLDKNFNLAAIAAEGIHGLYVFKQMRV